MSGAGAEDCARVDEPSAKARVKVKSQNRAGVDGPTAKERVAGSSVKRALAAQQAEARRIGHFLHKNPGSRRER